MSHHGWVAISAEDQSRAQAFESPFGRLFPATRHDYNSHAISLLAGALGPMHTQPGSLLKSTTKTPIPAGFTFFGQFVDHDLTEFRVVDADLQFVRVNPAIQSRQVVLEDGGDPTTTNGRSGRLDLDSVYGLLGGVDRALFDDAGRFIIRLRNSDQRPVDIQRNVDYRDGRLIADPRNDENKIIVQLHVLFQRLHNALHVDATSPEGVVAAVEATRQKVVAAYRRIVLYDYLPRVVDPTVVVKVGTQLAANRALYQKMNRRVRTALGTRIDAIVDGRFPHDGTPVDADAERRRILAGYVAMPVEFSHAVFRLGHSQLRDGYLLAGTKGLRLFVTGQAPTVPPENRDLRGNSHIDDDIVIEWENFFGPTAQNGEPLDASLPASVFRLPPPAIDAPPVSLAERNIRRGVDFGLPSGQEAARILDYEYDDVPVLTPDQVLPPGITDQFPELAAVDGTLSVTTPLWYYILRESSELVPVETHLGPVGSYVVAETILGSLTASEGFDVVDALADYGQKILDAQQPNTGNQVDGIQTVEHLLAFLAAPGSGPGTAPGAVPARRRRSTRRGQPVPTT